MKRKKDDIQRGKAKERNRSFHIDEMIFKPPKKKKTTSGN